MTTSRTTLTASLCCLLVFFAHVDHSRANTVTASGVSYAEVSAAIANANSGDTVVLPAGSATWTQTLTINKGIILKGAGSDLTRITKDIGSTWLLKYVPAMPAWDEPFRITGIMFDMSNQPYGIKLQNTTTLYPLRRIRFDHNTVVNAGAPIMEINGPVFGVMDHNTMFGAVHIDNYGQNNLGDWANLDFSLGSADNFYIEDNIIEDDGCATTGGHGGRYVWRYNTFTFINADAGLHPWFDMHGNQSTAIGPRGGEIYGNKITSLYSKSVTAFDHRGGQMAIFFNKVDSSFQSAWGKVREEYADSITSTEFTMHVNNSYYWNNRFGNGLLDVYIAQNSSPEYQLAENVDFWVHKTAFDGTQGIGCGPLSARPTTCVPGVGYWATDQDCTTISDSNVGANPQTPISGTLYRCTAPNVWTAYYTPYQYPHPLTAEQVAEQNVNVVVDNADPAGKVEVVGSWTTSTWAPGFSSQNYFHDGNGGKGTKSVTFRPNLPESGDYTVFMWYPAQQPAYPWASNVPVDIVHQGGSQTISVDESVAGSEWVELGTYAFGAGTDGYVRIRTTGTTGYVIADAIRFDHVSGPGSTLSPPQFPAGIGDGKILRINPIP